MAEYTNDLRLKEIGTGESSGTWGTETNTNLELIAEAFSYATEATFDSDADKTEIIADGATDPYRSLYVKVTSGVSLTATRTLTISPNTVSKVWIIENATSGSQSISISQGSGANVTVPNGDVKVIYSDGAGSGAAVVDAFASLSVGDLTATNLAGTLSTAAQTNITSVGTLTGLTVNGNVSVDGGTIKLDGDHPTGTDNVALGDAALGSVASGASGNTAIGTNALTALTTGDRNTAIGIDSLKSITGAEENTAMGREALRDNTANANTAMGEEALKLNTSATSNTAIGWHSMNTNTTGNQNTALGSTTLNACTTGSNNTSVGFNSLSSITTADENTGVGAFALNATTGARNTAVGYAALINNTSATNNTAVGRSALQNATTGADNTAIGRNALDALTTGTNSVAIGESALSTVTTSSGNTAVGKDALAIVTGADNTAVGKKAGDAVGAHTRNTFIGDSSGGAVNSSDNTFVGQNSGSAITTGDANTILGRYDGNQGSLDLRTSSNNIVLSDGDGNPQFFITSDGKTNINSVDTTPRGILNIQGTVANAVTTLLSFGDMGVRGAGTAQAIDFVMGRTGFISEDACASFRAVCEGESSTSVSHTLGFEFHTGNGTGQHMFMRLRSSSSILQLHTDEVPTYGNPPVSASIVLGPTGATGLVNGGLTDATVIYNKSGELYATDSSLNNTQLTPHNWELISDGPSEELAWTYWSQRPTPGDRDTTQAINVDMAKVVRKVEDLVGEKLIYTQNSNMDNHEHQSIIADIQSTLADLTTRIEALEA
jgi:hypothetical protein